MEQQAFSIKQSANILGVHPDTVRRAIKSGHLKAAKIGRDYRIARSALERYFEAMGGGSLFEANNPKSNNRKD